MKISNLGTKGGRKGKRILNMTHLLTRMSTGRPWERYSTMMVQKNSGFQWSGHFLQPPSAIGNEDLNTRDLISKQNMEIRKEQLQHNQNKHLTARKIKLKYTLRLKMSIINT